MSGRLGKQIFATVLIIAITRYIREWARTN